MAGESQEFKDKFFQQLKKSVIPGEPIAESAGADKLSELLLRKEQLQKDLAAQKKIKNGDLDKQGSLSKELAEVMKKLIELGFVEEVVDSKETDKNIVKDDERNTKAEQEENLKDLTNGEEEKKQKIEKSNELKEKYYAALVALYNYKISNIEEAKGKESLVTTRESFEREVVMETEMYALREEYLSLGNEDPFVDKRTQLIEQEREAKEPIERELRERARKYKETEKQIANLDKREKEINKKLLSPDITSVEIENLNKELEEIGAKRVKLEKEAVELRKDLEPAVNERMDRAVVRAGLEELHLETLTKEDRKNYEYQQSKTETMMKNTEQGINQEYDNIKKRIEEREQHLKDLKRELDETPSDDFERRLELLGKLDKETSMLEADKTAKRDVDRGIKLSPKAKQKEITKNYEKEQAREEEFIKETQATRELIKEQDKIIGENVVAEPIKTTMVDEKSRTVESRAATYAIVKDNPHREGPDTALDDYRQFKQAEIAASVICGLENKVVDIEDPEQAKKYLETNERIEKANKELEKQAEELTDKTV